MAIGANRSVIGTLAIATDWDNEGLKRGANEAERISSKLGRSMGPGMAKTVAIGAAAFAALSAATVGATVQLVKLGAKFDEASDLIRKGTGATGDALDDLNASFKKVYGTVSEDSATVAQVMADLNTRTGQTGEGLEALSQQMLELSRVSGESATTLVPAVTRAFGDWSIATDRQADAMDWLWKVSQTTGIGIASLTQQMVQSGAPLRELGYDFETATALLGKFEKEGVNTQAILASLKMGLSRMAAEGFDNAKDALAELIGRIKEMPEGLDAIGIAVDIFGSRAAADFALAIREGRLEVDDLVASLEASGESINKAAEDTDDLAENWEKFKHRMEVKLEPLASKLFEGVNEGFDALATAIETGEWSEFGTVIGKLVGEGVEAAAPVIGQMLTEVLPKLFTGIFEGAAKAWWDEFKRTQMEVAAERSRSPANLGYGDITQIRRKDEAAAEKRAHDEMVRLIKGLPQDDWLNIRKATSGADFFATIPSVFREVGEAAADTADDLADYGKQAFDAANYTEQLADITKSLESAYASIVTPISTWNEMLTASKTAAEEAGVAWDASKMSLTDYLDVLEEQLAAWADLETNLLTLVDQGLTPEAAMKAAERGAEFVQLLVGAEPDTRMRAFNLLEDELDTGMDVLATELYKRWYEIGEESGENTMSAQARAMERGWTNIERDSLTSGEDAGAEYGRGYLSGVEGQLAKYKPAMDSLWGSGWSAGSFAAGKVAGGATMEELLRTFGAASALVGGSKGGLTNSTASVWNTVKSIHPYATWMGGYNYRKIAGTNKMSDHATGKAFDTGGTPAQMQAIANTLARNFQSWGLKYIIYNQRINKGSGWVPYRGVNPHTDHVHVSTYDSGGLLPPGQTLATNYTGGYEVVLPADWIDSLTGQIDSLVQAIRDAVNADASIVAGTKGSNAMLRMMDLFADRASGIGGFITREGARLGMQEAQGLDPSVMASTLTRQIEFINMAVVEAQIALDTAKAQYGSTPEQINELATNLFDLQAEAARARQELEALARLPLEQAVSRWNTALSQTQMMFDLVGSASNALQLQSALLPALMGQMGASYQNSFDLMSMATTPEQVMGYGSDALGSLSFMFSAEQGMINRALDDTLQSISSQQSEWTRSWRARSQSVSDSAQTQQKALQDNLTALRKTQSDELEALTAHYDGRLNAMREGERAITREQQRNDAARSIGGLEDELRILKGQGYYTEDDIARMRQLETQIQEQRDARVRQEEAWAREDEQRQLEEEKAAQIALLQQQQQAEMERLQAQVTAAQERAQAQQQAMQAEYEAQMQAFERQQEAARQAAQAEIDEAVRKYQVLMQEVIDHQNDLLGQQWDYQNAGYQLGQSFADGLIAAIPAIQSAAQAAAQAAADYLELHSPAKRGPLADLNRWWEEFMPTLIRPLDTAGPANASARLAESVRGGIVTGERIEVHVSLSGDARGMDKHELAAEVGKILNRKVQVSQWGHGR